MQVYFFAAAALGGALFVLRSCIENGRWDQLFIWRVWIGAIGVGGFIFWLGAALILASQVWHLRSWFWTSTYIPSALSFPLLWWLMRLLMS